MNTEPRLRLLLIRHGETNWSRAGRFCGRSDPPLNATGIEQARALAEQLDGTGILACYSSPARRARRTAAILSDRLNIPLIERAELWEQDFGAWEGQLPAHVAAQDPKCWSAWQSGQASPPGGEPLAAVVKRAQSWLDDVARAHAAGTVLAVGHGGMLQAMLCALLGTPLRPLWPYRLTPGGVADVWLYPAGTVLVSLNAGSHV